MTEEKDELALFVVKLAKGVAKTTEDEAVRKAKSEDDPWGVAIARGAGAFIETWLDNVEKDIQSRKRRR